MEVSMGRTFIGRFPFRSDLLEELTGFCREHAVCLGAVTVIGAVTQARMGYYDQENQEYTGCVSLDEKLEITCCTGNISLKDGDPFVHVHITLAGLDGKAYGGHLMPGTKIFAAEYFIQEIKGGELHRRQDPETGLSLW